MGNRGHDNAVPVSPQQVALLEQGRRQIFAIVNHELRTPFITLQVCLETLQSEEALFAEVQQALLEVACGDLKRLCAMVQDLELLCRLEARQICFQTEPLDLRATLQATLSRFRKQTPEDVLSNIWMESAACLFPAWASVSWLLISILWSTSRFQLIFRSTLSSELSSENS